MLRNYNSKIAGLAIALTLSTVPLYACGFYLPNGVLFEDYALKVPKGYFSEEIELIEPPHEPGFEALIPTHKERYSQVRQYGEQTESGDIADLWAALGQESLGQAERERLLASYKSTRAAITEYTGKRLAWQWDKETETSWRRSSDPGPSFISLKTPEGLPGEFEDYIRGAIAYHSGRLDQAVQNWRRLLDRPAEQRQYKSTWAAFMIGKALLTSDPNEAVKWFERVRGLAKEGFADSIGLAASSLGWEARAELNRAGYARAIELYLAQRLTGDPTAMRSLHTACAAAVNSKPEVARKVAQNPTARRVVTAYLVSRIASWPCPRYKDQAAAMTKWLDAVETANVDFVKEADRFAWAAYYVGDMELTAKWLRLAPDDAPMAKWLRAKLLLRSGKVGEAAELLGQAARRFPPAPRQDDERQQFSYCYEDAWLDESQAKSVRGELGVLYLARRQYVEALDVLLAGGNWLDAAYIAECVLTPQELKAYVDRTWLPNKPDADDKLLDWPSWEAKGPDWICTKIRYLLARRLARLGKWEGAREYYPAEWAERFDAYAKALREASNEDLSHPQRAEAFWKAAIIARYEGMELLGTEVEPDWSVIEGWFYLGSTAEARRKRESEKKVLPSTRDEYRRAEQHVAVPNIRFHYRYTATQYAWRAAELMPDNSDETARVLCIAGSWMKGRDPNEADRFYKELVIRCPKTKLGQEADKLRWFPKVEIDPKKLLEQTK
jgi:hypothetical protein